MNSHYISQQLGTMLHDKDNNTIMFLNGDVRNRVFLLDNVLEVMSKFSYYRNTPSLWFENGIKDMNQGEAFDVRKVRCTDKCTFKIGCQYIQPDDMEEILMCLKNWKLIDQHIII